MIKQLFSVFFALFCFTFLSSGFYFLSAQVDIPKPTQAPRPYELPYPGMLPDHPLYFTKAIRDRIMDIVTRDTIKKAHLRLLYSDKRISMAQVLAKKGKHAMAVDTFSKGEKYFLSIPELISNSKKQGVAPGEEFVMNLKTANAKHYDIGQQLIKQLPQADAKGIQETLKITNEIKNELGKW